MRIAPTAILCLVALALAATAAAAPPAKVHWPRASDVRELEPGIADEHVACMVHGLRARKLRRGPYRDPFWDLTRVQKRALVVTRHVCMTVEEREVPVRRALESAFGTASAKLADGIACTAARHDETPLSDLQRIDSEVRSMRLLTRLARRCDLLGAAAVAISRPLSLRPTAAEIGCLNRRSELRPPGADAAESVAVFDECIGKLSEEGMYRRLLKRVGVTFAAAACAAPTLARTLTFVELFAGAPTVKQAMAKDVDRCS